MREWLKNKREEKHMTQMEISKISGITQQYYSFIEAGERGTKLPVQTAKKIANALEFDWRLFYEE